MRILITISSALLPLLVFKQAHAERKCEIEARTSAPTSMPTSTPTSQPTISDFTGIDTPYIKMPFLPGESIVGSPVNQSSLGFEYNFDDPNTVGGTLFHWLHWTGTGATHNAQLSIVPSDIKHIDIDMLMLSVSTSGSGSELTPDFYVNVYTTGTGNGWYEDRWILSLPAFTESDPDATDITSYRIKVLDWNHPETLLWQTNAEPYGVNVPIEMAAFETSADPILGIAIGSNTGGFIHAILNRISIELITGQTIDIDYTP